MTHATPNPPHHKNNLWGYESTDDPQCPEGAQQILMESFAQLNPRAHSFWTLVDLSSPLAGMLRHTSNT